MGFLGYLLGKNFRRRDRDHLVPPRGIDRVIDLHLWNEHVPLMPKQGATIAWARRMCFCIEVSLRELAKHLMARPELDDIRDGVSPTRARRDFHLPPSDERAHGVGQDGPLVE